MDDYAFRAGGERNVTSIEGTEADERLYCYGGAGRANSDDAVVHASLKLVGDGLISQRDFGRLENRTQI